MTHRKKCIYIVKHEIEAETKLPLLELLFSQFAVTCFSFRQIGFYILRFYNKLQIGYATYFENLQSLVAKTRFTVFVRLYKTGLPKQRDLTNQIGFNLQ